MKLGSTIILLGLAVLVGLGGLAPVRADDPKSLGNFLSWQALALGQEGEKTCYVMSQPAATKDAVKNRGRTAVMVSHFPDLGARDQVSVILGFRPAKGQPIVAKIGNKSFKLSEIEDDRAWVKSAESDKALIQGMIKASRLTILSVTAKGLKVEDTYSLRGFGKAYKAINTACPK